MVDQTSMHTQLIAVPYRYDEPDQGVGLGPTALLEAGLIDRLVATGLDMSPPLIAHLDPATRELGRTAVNIGKLGADTARLVAESRRAGQATLVLTGDDTAAIGVIAGLQAADGAGSPIGVVWLDAHGDFNTPETSFSGILAGMPLAIIAGLAGPQWRNASGMATPIPTDRIMIAGARDLDEQEAMLIRSTAVRFVAVDELKEGRKFQEQLDRLTASCSALLLHVDLDILDPLFVPSSSTPSENGLDIAETAAAMGAVFRSGKVAVVTISSLNPGGGQRGERSIQSALSLVEQALPEWRLLPPRSST
jgi:arginase